MSQPLKSINLLSPGFKGVNTEDSPVAQDVDFAEIADNAVIDRKGRLASRKGFLLLRQTKQHWHRLTYITSTSFTTVLVMKLYLALWQ